MEHYRHTTYFAKKKFLKLFGGEIKIFDQTKTQVLFFVKQKAFKLKEDITVFSDESMATPLLTIKARSIIDFSAAYDVTDATTGEKVGALRRRGFKSILQDSWELMNAVDAVVGTVTEDSMLMAVLRRFLTNLIPQSFTIEMGGAPVGILKQTFNPFVPQFNVDFTMDAGNRLDRRMGIATVILLQIIEGRQN
ncbi:MAG TPA: hypothetical protein PLE73_02390 [Spirochaetota bacterium]|nr:hypothetical protein [Spirochaetota bacterium]HPI22015.1 hypothetical protein [Spirochaetota bacterium]HPU89491.1 hypothetical protein [Spirochaetota bacterium]